VNAKNYNLYWGDIHIHSAVSRRCFNFGLEPEGYNGRPLDCYRFAREIAGLDFAAVTDHDCTAMAREMTEEEWQEVLNAAEKMNKEGKFVTIPAYEYSNRLYGHYNVYFLDKDAKLFSCDIYKKPSQLWKALQNYNQEAITIPHHTARFKTLVNWDYCEEKFEPVTEITSCWGDYEYAGNDFECDPNWSPSIPGHFVRDALQKGYMLGFVGGGDIHNGRSGGVFNIDVHKMKELPKNLKSMLRYRIHPFGGGLTGVYAKKLSRKDIFNAIKERRCYAASGYKIGLKFYLNEHIMGEVSQLDKEYPARLKVDVNSPHSIHCIEIIRNGHILARGGAGGREEIELSDGGNKARFEFIDKFKDAFRGEVFPEIKSPNGKQLIYYYARVTLKNGAKAWSSPIWLEK